MPSDNPDYTTDINISVQTAAQVTMRQKFGVSTVYSGSDTVPDLGDKQLVYITGKGTLYSGWCKVECAADISGGQFYFLVDHINTGYDTFETLESWNISKPQTGIFYLLHSQNDKKIYIVGISRDITFEETLELRFKNTAAVVADVTFKVHTGII